MGPSGRRNPGEPYGGHWWGDVRGVRDDHNDRLELPTVLRLSHHPSCRPTGRPTVSDLRNNGAELLEPIVTATGDTIAEREISLANLPSAGRRVSVRNPRGDAMADDLA
jgi:hypothetical protein